jgi:hypothetical protein
MESKLKSVQPALLLGVQEVPGSNPGVPTNPLKPLHSSTLVINLLQEFFRSLLLKVDLR